MCAGNQGADRSSQAQRSEDMSDKPIHSICVSAYTCDQTAPCRYSIPKYGWPSSLAPHPVCKDDHDPHVLPNRATFCWARIATEADFAAARLKGKI